jgi:predicted RNA-binding protein with PUA domain
MNSNKKIISPINDYSCLHNKGSEFLYTPIENCVAYGIRKEFFNELLENPIAKRIKKKITQNYAELIQQTIHEHREEMAKNFENRIDYVDIKAYGVGKVKID